MRNEARKTWASMKNVNSKFNKKPIVCYNDSVSLRKFELNLSLITSLRDRHN